LTGVTSACRTNQMAEFDEPMSVDQTWTVPVLRPPVTVTLTVCAAVVPLVS
jgi:hypothetical protein